jgi:putative spermidine/putrescine transport system ATP-binding protein
MGMVFQSYSLFPNLTVAKNVEFGLRTRKVAPAERHRRVAEMLELVQLTQPADRTHTRSRAARQQRVALARALAVQPSRAAARRAAEALDAKVRTTLRDEIRRIQTEVGITTLFVTHDQEEALAISDRIVSCRNGRVEQLGTPTRGLPHPYHGVRGPVRRLDERALLVRPEDMHLAEGGLPGTVVTCTFQGAATVLGVRLDTVDVLTSVHVAGVADLNPGERVEVGIDGARAVCETIDDTSSVPVTADAL